MTIDLPPQYDPKAVEKAIYQKWLDARAFHAVPDDRPNRFSIVIPPPNVTGALHLGHALNVTIQDSLTRYHRMKGDNTLWMPGIDHAGIATQAVVEKTIFEKEKKTRHDLGREELVKRIWEWKEQFGTRILSQLQATGASCDWDRTRFTLDEVCAKAVREAFFKMFKDGLIFRGKRLVNWDTHLQTAVADDEIYHEPVKGQLTSIKYPVADETDSETRPSGSVFLVVATTRPETMLGDTAVAVHPDDPRYKHLIGQHVILPLIGRKIPIIADGLLVDPAFGTGVVKVTPAHDPNDYATGQRHNLEIINLLTPDGKVNENGQSLPEGFMGKHYTYTGLKFATAARKKVLEDLESLGLIADNKPHDHEIGHSDRSKTPIEPYLSDQWFVRMGDISVTRPLGSVVRGSGEESSGETLPDGRVTETVPAHSSALAYFITFRTYGTWLHGDEQGSIDPQHNVPGTPFVPPDAKLLERDRNNLKHPPLELSIEQRQSVFKTLQEVAAHRGWRIRVLNVRATHVHVVVSGSHSPERMMNDFKSWSTRRMVEADLLEKDRKAWSRHGSTKYLWGGTDIEGAVHYALQSQGENSPGTWCSVTQPSGSVSPPHPPAPRHTTLPNGRVTDGIVLADGTRAPGLAQAAIDAVQDGRVKITPDRYAKGYIDWLSQKRDWCISRQLWWGHRIPVWHQRITITSQNRDHLVDEGELEFLDAGDPVPSAYMFDSLDEANRIAAATVFRHVATGEIFKFVNRPEGAPAGAHHNCMPWVTEKVSGDFDVFVCINHNSPNTEKRLEAGGFVRDPDVLDTWFSSALWPLSTMGWPNPGTTDKPEDQLLPCFYPTSVLSTAREILTLWVARMVIFGLYCKGDVPFKNVYIHAVIQDGEGRPMKKTLGNGVDPVEIVNSHGADALRFTLASMATETQDIRIPVVKDPKTGINTSLKFDLGRNFANKIWNAARYILSNINEQSFSPGPWAGQSTHLEDRWILSRLNTTIQSAETAINQYRFADLAEALRTFFWTDLCDWYLEISKSRIKSGDQTVQQILLHCLRTSLQLLHPLMPFITEELWSKLPRAPDGNPGLSPSLLITAPWPEHDPSHNDPAAESHLALIQSVTSAIREIQNRYPAAKGKPVILQPRDAATQQLLEKSRAIIEPLAAAIAQNSPTATKPENAATAVLPECQIFIEGVIDKSAESAKLTKRKAELEKFIAGNQSKLANESFTSKAPEKIIQGLRDQLAKQQEELAAIEKNLAELK